MNTIPISLARMPATPRPLQTSALREFDARHYMDMPIGDVRRRLMFSPPAVEEMRAMEELSVSEGDENVQNAGLEAEEEDAMFTMDE